MATEAVAGHTGKLFLSTAVGQTPAALAELRDYSLLIEADEIDATSHQSSGDSEAIMGKIGWSATAGALHIQGNTGHQSLYDVLVNRVAVNFEFYPTGNASEGYLFGKGYIDEWQNGSPLSDASAVDLGIIGTETLEMWQGPFYPSVSSGLMVLVSTDTDLRFALSSGLMLVSSSGTYVGMIRRGSGHLSGLLGFETT